MSQSSYIKIRKDAKLDATGAVTNTTAPPTKQS